MSRRAALRQQVHLSYIYKTHFYDQELRIQQHKSSADEFELFLLQAGANPEPQFQINSEDIVYYTFAEVWMWYRYYSANVRTWEHRPIGSSFHNKAYWSRIPSNYRSLKHIDKKLKSLEAMIKGVEKKFPGRIEQYKERLDGGECGFVWKVNSKPITADSEESESAADEQES